MSQGLNRVMMGRKLVCLQREGVIARLCGSAELGDQILYAQQWREWMTTLPARTTWPDWQTCHAEFGAYLETFCTLAGYDLGGES